MLQNEGKITEQEVNILHHGTTVPGKLGLGDLHLKEAAVKDNNSLARSQMGLQQCSEISASLKSSSASTGSGNRMEDNSDRSKQVVRICQEGNGSGINLSAKLRARRKLSRAFHVISFITSADDKKPKWLPSKVCT